MKTYKKVLIIAGSDSGGGAGIQADIKTTTMLGCYASTAITAITAQNTLGVQSVHYLDETLVQSQIESVLSDIGTDAIKVGMLGQKNIIDTVQKHIKNKKNTVIDPVMVATSGDRLVEENAIAALKSLIKNSLAIVTPNLAEAEIFLGESITKQSDMKEAALELQRIYECAFLLKGGHLSQNKGFDLYVDTEGKVTYFEGKQILTQNTHGTGCSLSTAIASYLAKGKNKVESIRLAKQYLTDALDHGKNFKLGSGKGPIYHNYNTNEDFS